MASLLHQKLRDTVSVVVTTRNEAGRIGRCLQSILEQTHPDIETIVVDNHSTDNTPEIARRYTHLVCIKGPERSAQRNFGIMHVASGRYVLYLDADMILSPGLVESCLELSLRSGCRALHIPEIVLGANYWSRVRRFERSFYNGTPVDAARFIERDLFIRIGGFDETLSGPEDWDLDKRIRQSTAIKLLDVSPREDSCVDTWSLAGFIRAHGVDPLPHGNVIYHDEADFALGRYLRKKGYYAGSFSAYEEKWGKNDPDLRKQVGLGYRLFGVFFEGGKWKRLPAHASLSAGMYLLKFLVGSIYLAGSREARRV